MEIGSPEREKIPFPLLAAMLGVSENRLAYAIQRVGLGVISVRECRHVATQDVARVRRELERLAKTNWRDEGQLFAAVPIIGRTTL